MKVYADDGVEIFFDACSIKTTDKALCLVVEGEDTWIPRSVVVRGFGAAVGDVNGKIFVKRWFAEKEGLV